MDDENVRTLKREIRALRDELEHVFPEHEEHYRRLCERLKVKSDQLEKLSPANHWWQKIFR